MERRINVYRLKLNPKKIVIRDDRELVFLEDTDVEPLITKLRALVTYDNEQVAKAGAVE